jgi:hypothetical protein
MAWLKAVIRAEHAWLGSHWRFDVANARLALPYVVLKKLANHSGRNDTTFGYLVVDVERLREPMQMITNERLLLCKASKARAPEWQPGQGVQEKACSVVI